MHVAADINWILQGVVLGVAAALGLVIVVRKAASRYFVVDSNFGSSAAADFSSLSRGKGESGMGEVGGDAAMVSYSCAVCGLAGKKQCGGCKMVKYCSEDCQISHWKSEHKSACSKLQSEHKKKSNFLMGTKRAATDRAGKEPKILKPSNKILFPYEEFVNFFNRDKLNFPPCGLLNCGNSCFANVVLQCLAYTRPLVVYLLLKGHRTDCRMDDWCFLCELQNHVERSGQSLHPFSPMNILSRLPNIGGNLGYGRQEDAHEFMRYAIDTMQSVCLDEFGGEKVVLPKYQETTLIQHIFGGRLRSQVICTQCNNISNQFENMMDLTVEIQGDAGSLEECLDQFTAKEKLHGDNMYKCDGCNGYVTAWKRLTVQQAPNILTIALKRFQSGRFGKLNKRVTFPETLDLRPYMSELEDENDFYKLYAVIVHVDMLNASFFGHYICYIKDFHGNWYRIDDCKVASVELDEVLSQGAYMLLYSRVCARPSCLLPHDNSRKVVSECEGIEEAELQPLRNSSDKCLPDASCHDSLPQCNGHLSLEISSAPMAISTEELPVTSDLLGDKSGVQNMLFSESGSPTSVMDTEIDKSMSPSTSEEESVSPMILDNQMCGGTATTSLIDETSSPSEVENPVSSSPIPVISNASCGSKTYANGDLMGLLSEEPTTSQDCSSNGGDPPYSTTSKASQQVDVENSNASSNGVSEGAKKLSGGSSGAKLKPVFQPGFLVKMPRRRSAIRT